MRIYEIFEGYKHLIEDGDALMDAGRNNMLAAKRQVKNGEIAKLKDRTAEKQRELSQLTTNIKPIKPKPPKAIK